MAFQKLYSNDATELSAISLMDRHRYYPDRSLLRAITEFTHQDEPLVGQKTIEQNGLLCKPFWDDELEGQELDSEGKAFQAYRQQYPNFDLMIRQAALERLIKVDASLPSNMRLVLKAGLRPVSVQQVVFDEELANTKSANPSWTNDEAYKHTLEYVTDPAVNLPPHSSGGTIDVHVWNTTTDAYVDMGSPINAIDDRSWSANTDGMTAEQIANRSVLREAMTSNGLAPLASEWWHFSFGDQRWAVFYGHTAARYGNAMVTS